MNSDSDKLKYNEILLFVNDDYCEILCCCFNVWYYYLLFQVLIGFMVLFVLFFVIFFLCIIDIGEIIKGYIDLDCKGRGILVLVFVIFIVLFIISFIVFNYFLFVFKDYLLCFNCKIGKVYVYDYVNLYVWYLVEMFIVLFKFFFFFFMCLVEKVFDW